MTLRFIAGRAGTGKTQTCLQEIAQEVSVRPEGQEMIFLVPEQATFQMEAALTSLPGLEGLMGVQVLGFRRLAWRVLGETGGAARAPIGELGKRMVLRHLLNRYRDKLCIFANSAGRFGFVDNLVRAIGELKTYCITPSLLQDILGSLPPGQKLMEGKLADLQLLYAGLEAFLQGKFTDPDDYLTLLAEQLKGSIALQGAEFWVDGFTGFTPQEYRVLQKMMVTAGRVNVTLTIEPEDLERELAEEDLFYPTWRTYRDLSQLAREAGVEIEKPLILAPAKSYRFQQARELAHLEKHFFSYPAPEFQGKGPGLKVVAAANRRAEVEGAAREIIRLCRDKGLRWRDVLLVLRDLEPYHQLIADIFQDYGIPFFIDYKRPVLHHPLVELLRSALEIQVKDWAYEPVFRCLKTDLLPVSRDDVDRLENYVLAHGIKGSKWTGREDWAFYRSFTVGEKEDLPGAERAHLAEINRIRRKASQALFAFTGRIKGTRKVRDLTAALYLLLEELQVRATLQSWSEAARERGDLEKAREHQQIWGSVIGLLDEIVEALGEEELSPEEYLEVLDAGLESLRLGLIPPGLDQVLVGSLERSRNPNVRAAFVLGASDGVFPAKPAGDGLFNDTEREMLAESGLQLAPGSRRRVFDEQYLVYHALTRAGEFLWISYPLADEEGRAIAPSPVISRLRQLFPDQEEIFCQVEPQGDQGDAGEFIVHPKGSLVYLGSRLREAKGGQVINPVWWDVYNWFARDPARRRLAQGVLAGLFHTNQEKPISPKITRKLYGLPLKASVSRVELYQACPFAHFANYGLRLKERAVFKLAAPDLGEFFHAALKVVAEKLTKDGLGWGWLTREQCDDISSQVVEELAPRLQNEILLSSARYRYLTGKLKKILSQAVYVLAEHARRSSFRPVGLELAFGSQGELPPLILELSGGSLELNGRIDRIDLAQIGEKTYLRVIDYKSSDNRLKFSEIYYGLKLQLLAYLHVALAHGEILTGRQGIPAGGFYFTVKDPVISHSGPLTREEMEARILKEFRMEGFLLAEPEVARHMDNQLETGRSELFKVALTRDNTFQRSSQVFSEEELSLLRQHLEDLLREAGEGILRGQVRIAPYRHKKNTACTYCSYRPVCKFDLLLEDNLYRLLKAFREEEIWLQIKGKGGDGSGTKLD